MANLSNNITAFLNFLAFMCSIPIIASGTWLASKPDNECIHWLRWPVVFIGIAIMLVSLTGFVGAYWKKEGLLGVYLVCMAILIVLLLVLLVLAFVVTGPTGSYMVPGRAYHEYRLEGFSYWLRDHITSADNWGNIRACLADSGICPRLNNHYVTAEQFFAADLSPIQSGCCKPPTICGYQYMTPILWTNPTNAIVDADCSIWNNDPSQLCYNCDSCKAGLLGNLRKEWRKSNLILIITLVILIWVYLIGCCAYRNTLTKPHSKK
ncbi:PREDICTED: tetraspanin-2 [Nicotiana attenuata]|uniref:Tetraspanin-2 n=1 Tax=Nicotiana attenuata TaxID=49451 RepID=A0A314L4J2_NICAT|nr:PREDICTED: tetraspanin-2 [Nicotiana attenuata]OIT36510.1 tetraspanin-2 [Nicotiana attenuata]